MNNPRIFYYADRSDTPKDKHQYPKIEALEDNECSTYRKGISYMALVHEIY